MNFALILFTLLVVTGLAALADRLILAPRRKARHGEALAAADAQLVRGGGETEKEFADRREKIRAEVERKHAEPWWSEYSKSFFPVILVVFLLRSFLVEPFKIPSGSMLPTLLIGDFILVNKYTYGVRLPIVNVKILEMNNPKRGDVMVFRYPHDESVDYIKRVIGLPGDKVAWTNKRLFVNDVAVPTDGKGEFVNPDRYQVTPQFEEVVDGRPHRILLERDAPPVLPFIQQFAHREMCTYTPESVTCTVPPGHYFMMGDNRDNSQDSRVWGFVPDRNIVGRAFFIWFNLSDFSRIGSFR